MKQSISILLGAASLLAPWCARAATTCGTFTPPNYTKTYVGGAAPATTVLQIALTLSCTRALTTDPNIVVLYYNGTNGSNSSGSQNRAVNGANYLGYEYYTNSCLGNLWTNNGSSLNSNSIPSAFTQAISWLQSETSTKSSTFYTWACVSSAQYPPVGTYIDTFTTSMERTFLYSFQGGQSGPFLNTFSTSVSIDVQASCSINPAPGSITLNYTSFAASPATGQTGFSVTCNSGTAYTMTVTPASNNLRGIDYAMSLSPATTPGTGSAQPYVITATPTPGQAGTCAVSAGCSSNQTHSLNLSF